MGNISEQQFKKNFFYSADSEHYQDAVLTYIFYNYPEAGKQDKDLSEIERFSIFFTKQLLNKKGINITGIDVETQKYDSDIDLIIHTTDGKDHLVIIEDKTGSAIHPSVKKQKNSKDKNSETLYYNTQLEKYFDKYIHDKDFEDFFKEGRIHLFYYKNEYVNDSEKKTLKKASEGCKEILCAPFVDQIEEIKKEIYKLKNDGKSHNASTFEKRENAIKELELKNIEFASNFDRFGTSIVEWVIRDIDWIYDTFNEFYKGNKAENIILRDYFESIDFWKKEIDIILNNNYTIERVSGTDLKWGDRSKLWNPVFCQMIDAALKQIKDDSYETQVATYAGRYWEMAIHSKDKKTCVLANTKGITNESFSIGINLRNAKYNGKENVPARWNEIEGEREKEGNRIIDLVNKNRIKDADLTLGSRMKKGDQDNNKICSYEFKFKPGEKADYGTLFDKWMQVVEFFVNNIDGK